MIAHLLFLMFVGIAVYAQSVTGFALSFILLGLIGTINLVPIVDAVNIVSVILVINSITFLYKRWPMRFEKILWPALVTSLIWTALGMLLLVWLAGVKYEIARLLLGISIVVCALLLWQKKTFSQGIFFLDICFIWFIFGFTWRTVLRTRASVCLFDV
jgi:hypothetical protein